MKRCLLILACAALASLTRAQQFDRFSRERMRVILSNIAEDVKKHYYDPAFHGVDFDAQVREADRKLQQATNVTESLRIIAATLGSLNDSATYFIPPLSNYTVDYGWEMQMVGSHCYVTYVRPKSDAETKGLKAGDEIVSINQAVISRGSFPTLEYLITVLSRQPELQIHVRTAVGKESDLKIEAKVEPIKIRDIISDGRTMITEYNKMKHRNLPRCESLGEEAMLCKVPDLELEPQQVNEFLKKIEHQQALILDLRGNRYGNMESLKRLTAGFFDHEIKIGDQIGRSGVKPQSVPGQRDCFTGKLVVILDSRSGSVSELFARTVQIEKRGTIVGDRSAGMVRQSKRYEYHFTTESLLDSYRALITEADVVMADGQSLENKGVAPDLVALPTPGDIANGYDPALSAAADRAGVKLASEAAGKILPRERLSD